MFNFELPIDFIRKNSDCLTTLHKSDVYTILKNKYIRIENNLSRYKRRSIKIENLLKILKYFLEIDQETSTFCSIPDSFFDYVNTTSYDKMDKPIFCRTRLLYVVDELEKKYYENTLYKGVFSVIIYEGRDTIDEDEWDKFGAFVHSVMSHMQIPLSFINNFFEVFDIIDDSYEGKHILSLECKHEVTYYPGESEYDPSVCTSANSDVNSRYLLKRHHMVESGFPIETYKNRIKKAVEIAKIACNGGDGSVSMGDYDIFVDYLVEAIITINAINELINCDNINDFDEVFCFINETLFMIKNKTTGSGLMDDSITMLYMIRGQLINDKNLLNNTIREVRRYE